MGNSFTDRQWRHLLTDIECQQVVPVIGPELLVFDQAGKRTTLYQQVAQELVARLNIKPGSLTAEYSLQDVASIFLQDPGNETEYLQDEIRDLLKNRAFPTPEPLKQLAEISHFDLFVSTTFDSLLHQALAEARPREAIRTIAYSEKKAPPDLSMGYQVGGETTIFHLFGRLDASRDYAITEDKILEFSHRLQSRDLRPQNLFDVLRKRNLLILGCSFPGWLARFLLRATKGDELLMKGARGVVADQSSHHDPEFVMFLKRRKTELYSPGDACAFVQELHRRWTEQFGDVPPPKPSGEAAPKLPDFTTDSVFISYASEDLAFAQQVKEAFDRGEVDAWFDKSALEPGDDYKLKILKNIENCSCFVPLVSRHAATLDKRFFQREWNKALDESQAYPRQYQFIQPVLVDDTPLDAPGIPPEFKTRHIVRLENVSQLVDAAKLLIRERRRQRRSS